MCGPVRFGPKAGKISAKKKKKEPKKKKKFNPKLADGCALRVYVGVCAVYRSGLTALTLYTPNLDVGGVLNIE